MTGSSESKAPAPRGRGITPKQPSFGQTQQLLGELPVILSGLQTQSENTHKLMKRQLAVMQNQEATTEKEVAMLGLIHDRLDALAIETRVTNLLLSELVAIHQTVISEETDAKREVVRNHAYMKVLNGE